MGASYGRIVWLQRQQQRLAQLRRLRGRPLRANHYGTHTSAQKRAKALFCSTAPALLRSSADDSKAAHLRQPLLSRRCTDQRCFSSYPTQGNGAGASVWRRGAALGVVEERSRAGAFEQNSALALFCAALASTAEH